jgi:hypothetical protein
MPAKTSRAFASAACSLLLRISVMLNTQIA